MKHNFNLKSEGHVQKTYLLTCIWGTKQVYTYYTESAQQALTHNRWIQT